MQAVEFETEIMNDTICIPQEYKGHLPHKARIIIMPKPKMTWNEFFAKHPPFADFSINRDNTGFRNIKF